MKLDVQRRLEGAFSELLLADPDVSEIAGERIWPFGDATHRAEYPCVLMNTVSSFPAGKTETGWYEFRFQLLGSTFRSDDKSKGVMRTLVGALTAVAQRTTLCDDLNATLSAVSSASALTVTNVRIDGSVQDEEGDSGQIYSGLTLAVVCAPFTRTPRPTPLPPSAFDPSADPAPEPDSGGESP